MESITIAGYAYKAEICLRGGGLQGLSLNGHAVTTAYSDFDNRIGAEGDILAPFPGRINKGQYHFDGHDYQLAINERSGEHAIHGFVRTLQWDVIAHSASEVTVGVVTSPVSGYPFSIGLQLHYALSASGLRVTATAKNLSDTDAPFGIGYHSYALIPTGEILDVSDAGVDYRSPRVIGAQVIDNCFVTPQGETPTVVLSGATLDVNVWMDATAYPNCVLFTGDTLVDGRKRRALAIEPMSCTSDGFNHEEWGLTRLSPGATWSGAWGVSAKVVDGSGS
jgi:aldose 1-epimerase